MENFLPSVIANNFEIVHLLGFFICVLLFFVMALLLKVYRQIKFLGQNKHVLKSIYKKLRFLEQEVKDNIHQYAEIRQICNELQQNIDTVRQQVTLLHHTKKRNQKAASPVYQYAQKLLQAGHPVDYVINKCQLSHEEMDMLLAVTHKP
jgi:biopolymer transport protein ExbB/TolQ